MVRLQQFQMKLIPGEVSFVAKSGNFSHNSASERV